MNCGKNFFVGFLDFLTRKKTLFYGDSSFNGEITVSQDIFGKYLLASGLTQSGGMVELIWKKAVAKIHRKKVERVLILGLGAGSCIKAVLKKWPKATIIGVEIDSIMVELGKKFFGLSDFNIDIKIEDANNFIAKSGQKFDLIIVDLFSGEKQPQFLGEKSFLKNLKKIIERDGFVIFNQLYLTDCRGLTNEFVLKLKKYFRVVNKLRFPFFIPTNLLIFCRD